MLGKGLLLVILMVGLAVGLGLDKQAGRLLSEALGQKAEIVVEAQQSLGPLPRPWPNFAQGGEESNGMIGQIVNPTKALKPEYIRIDHIYDFYQLVSKDNGRLKFDWSRLDKEVEAILATGAKPFLALSYLPPALASGVAEAPTNWGEWQELVRATIEHYSGKTGKNLSNVYYEVWNEPDLFGAWKTYGEKNYLSLYRAASAGAKQAGNVQPFKLGGPATTGMYENWMEAVFKTAAEENWRLDFVSWHRYSFDPDDFAKDLETFVKLVGQYPRLALVERIISEWGFDPENHPGYDGNLGAAHGLATIRAMLGRAHKAFVFEIMDGKDPGNQVYWGRFGLLTHPSTGLNPKPRYKLFLWLNELGPERLLLSGEGTWVKGLAAKKDSAIQIYLTNYDKRGQHWESVPVIVKNLTPGSYQVSLEWFDGRTETNEVTITSGTFVNKVSLAPNSLVRISLSLQNR